MHTLLLRNACTSPEEEAYKKLNFLARWPLILHTQYKNGLKNRTRENVETGQKLTRVLLTQLIGALKEDTMRNRPGKGVVTWQNVAYIGGLVEEIVMGSLLQEEDNNSGDKDMADSGREFNVSILKWI